MKYLAFYDDEKNKKENRKIVLSATNKITYILECLDKLSIPCHVISAAGTDGKKTCKRKEKKLFDNITLELPLSFGKTSPFLNVLDRWQIKFKLLLKLLKTPKTETVLVYHSLYYMRLVAFAKRLKQFRLIVEVEEIYGDVMENKRISNKELSFFSKADGYLFSTELLNRKINTTEKPSVVIYGTYKVEEQREKRFNDGKTHAVYAGTLDPRKGGALAAAMAGSFLNEKYHIHILGFGTNEEKGYLLQVIQDVCAHSDCKVTYDGLLSGEEYIRFLQSCDIGLSTQKPDAQFNDTSFPSKILSYMANGIRVVSARIPVVEASAIDDYVYYYEEQSPQKISEAISKVDLQKEYNGSKVIAELNEKFKEELKNILGE